MDTRIAHGYLGSFDRSISASASASEGDASVSAHAAAMQRVAFTTESIFGTLTARADTQGSGSQSRTHAELLFATEFRIDELRDVPYTLTGWMRSAHDPVPLAGNATARFALADLDTPDPHGGGTIVFALSQSPGFDAPLEYSGTLLAGHRYSLVLELIGSSGLLGTESGITDRSVDAEMTFSIMVPEPHFGFFVIACATSLLGKRRRAHGKHD